MLRSTSLAAFLAVLWLLLSGYFVPLLLTLGALSVVLTVVLSRRMGVVDEEGHPMELVFRGVRYFPWIFKEIVKSALDVSKVILKRRMPIKPSVITCTATQKTAVGRVIYADSITLTPGTVTCAIEGNTFSVHALTEAAAQGLLEGEMDRRVTVLEGQS